VEEIGVPGEVTEKLYHIKLNHDGGTLSCGPFQIKKKYWIACGRPGYSKL
jgi:hypothetical protein